mgnify:CR=1 FL=1
MSGTHKKLGARHKARKRAVDFLFEAEARDLDPVALASERSDLSVKDDAVAPVAAYTVTLVSGVAETLVGRGPTRQRPISGSCRPLSPRHA